MHPIARAEWNFYSAYARNVVHKRRTKFNMQQRGTETAANMLLTVTAYAELSCQKQQATCYAELKQQATCCAELKQQATCYAELKQQATTQN